MANPRVFGSDPHEDDQVDRDAGRPAPRTSLLDLAGLQIKMERTGVTVDLLTPMSLP